MELDNYALSYKNKELFRNVTIKFKKKTVNHILGNNGCGKSSFGKSCVGMMTYEGKIIGNEKAILIGSSSNVPGEFWISDIVEILKRKYDTKKVEQLYQLLKLNEVSNKLPIEKMSDGQKQKIKLLTFLSAENEVIILDEFTNALDKNSALDLYSFINRYIERFDVTVLNITHNLADLEYMIGAYYYVSDKNIVEIASKQEVINKYVKGE